MKQEKELAKALLVNKVFHYVSSRYATYIVQFVNSVLVAASLGPYYLGVWGFLTLVVQYCIQMNFGVAHSVNAILSVNKSGDYNKVISTALWMVLGISVAFGGLFFSNWYWDLGFGVKYGFVQYSFFIFVVVVLDNFNKLFANVFRVYGNVGLIAVTQSIWPAFMLIAILFFQGISLLQVLVFAYAVSYLISFLLFVVHFPYRIDFKFHLPAFRLIQSRGFHLFIYNSSFYLIVISTKFFVSTYYSVRDFGFFTFAFSFAQAILLLLQSLSFLVYPKLLNRFSNLAGIKAFNLLQSIRDVYVGVAHLLIHLSILGFPFFVAFFVDFQGAIKVFNLVAVAVVLQTNSFGYQVFLVAKGYEKILGVLAFLALCLNIVISFLIVEFLSIDFALVVLSTMITYFGYAVVIGFVGKTRMGLESSVWDVIVEIFPFRIIGPILISLVLSLIEVNALYYLLPLSLFVYSNFRLLLKSLLLFKRIVKDDSLIDL